MSDHLQLTKDKLSTEKITDLVTDSTTGAVSIFVGTTRDHFEGKRVVTLEYEAYEAMALKKMKDLCQMMRSKWPSLHNIAVFHRLGTVGPKEASVVIAITSTHRQACLEALPFAIDTLKATIPIWKKEVYEDSSNWKSNKECPWSNSNVKETI